MVSDADHHEDFQVTYSHHTLCQGSESDNEKVKVDAGIADHQEDFHVTSSRHHMMLTIIHEEHALYIPRK